MSLTLPTDHVRSPWQNGMVEGMVETDPRQYVYVAYRRPERFTWFAGPRWRAGVKPGYGGCVHHVLSSVTNEKESPKDDRQVAAVTYAGYVQLHYGEIQWWIDYDNHVTLLKAAWAAAEFPETPSHLLPPIPDHIHLQGMKFAHRMVARREGREEELPGDFDIRENVEADYPAWD